VGIRYLTTEEINQIHEDIIKESGGHSGIISYSNLDFVSNHAKTSKKIERVAATLFHGIVTSHPFVDGNKRTASVITETFLKYNGKELSATNIEVWEVVRGISQEKLKFEDVVSWIKDKIK
jgi:death-on-curing protein